MEIFFRAVVLLLSASAVLGTCFPPPAPESNMTVHVSEVHEARSQYETDKVILFVCEPKQGESFRYGTVMQQCKADGSWTAPDRKCSEESYTFGFGTAVGIGFCGFTMILQITLLLVASKKRNLTVHVMSE